MDSKHVLRLRLRSSSFATKWDSDFIMIFFFFLFNFVTIFFRLGFGCPILPILSEAVVLFQSVSFKKVKHI